MHISPEADKKHEQTDPDREETDQEHASKKAKTGLGMLLGDMFNMSAD